MILGCKRLKVKSSAPVPLAIFPYAFRVIIEGAMEGTSGSVWISRNGNVKFISFLSTSYSFERLRNITSYLDNLLIKTTF